MPSTFFIKYRGLCKTSVTNNCIFKTNFTRTISRSARAKPGSSEHSWIKYRLQEKYSRKGNLYVENDETVYVYRNRKRGQRVIAKINGKWEHVGRVDLAGHIFIGPKDQLSSAEYYKTPKGQELIKRNFMNYVKRQRKPSLRTLHREGGSSY